VNLIEKETVDECEKKNQEEWAVRLSVKLKVKNTLFFLHFFILHSY